MLLKIKESLFVDRDKTILSFYADNSFSKIFTRNDENFRGDFRVNYKSFSKTTIFFYLGEKNLNFGDINSTYIKVLSESQVIWIYNKFLEKLVNADKK